MSDYIKGSIFILVLCLVIQGIWMGIAPDPSTLAPVFKLIGGLIFLLAFLGMIVMSLALCVCSAVYAFNFDGSDDVGFSVGILALIAWFISVIILVQTNVKGEPIDLPADEISAMRFAILGGWALVFALAGLKAYFKAQRKKKETS